MGGGQDIDSQQDIRGVYSVGMTACNGICGEAHPGPGLTDIPGDPRYSL